MKRKLFINLKLAILARTGNIRIWFALAATALAIIVLGNIAVASVPASIPTEMAAQVADPSDPLGIADFNCADLARYGIEKQMNVRADAILAKCRSKGEWMQGASGATEAGSLVAPAMAVKLLAPLLYGSADVNLITGGETHPRVTQSTSSIWANGNKIVVAYVDSRGTNQNPRNYDGASVSTDGGVTFNRLTLPSGHSPFPNSFGFPSVAYHAPSDTWHTVSISGPCGSQGLGRFEAPNASVHDPNAWVFDGCVHSGGADDMQHMWVDNNPNSPFHGRMYLSWNDFSIGGGIIRAIYSTDGGTTWSAPVNLTAGFIRNVHLTGDVEGGGAVYIAGMDEMGGGLGNRANKMYRSTDGGVTWTNTYTGPTFPGPGRGTSGYFATMFTSPAYWRNMGYGQHGALGNVVHYTYASRNPATGDPGDVFYIRSTDMGVTFSPPIRMNTDTGTRAQWMPSLSVGPSGGALVGWYDERETANCAYGDPSVPCYRRLGRASHDNGATWLPDEGVGDAVSPLPAQPDPSISSIEAGFYDHAFSQGDCHYQAWTDGRVAIGGQSQQDVAFDVICGLGGTPTPTPTNTPTIIPTITRTPTIIPTRTATPSCTEQATVGPWAPVATYTVTVRNPAIATDGTYLYSIGGTDGFRPRDIVQRYDPATNTWLARANLPIELEAARAAYAAVNNKIYVFGGYNAGGSVINNVYVYDITTNGWSTGAPMPDARRLPNVAYYGGNQKIYVIGGHSVGPEQNQTWEYDPVANTWNTSRANIPVPMGSSATSIVGQHIYLMGSEGGGGGTTLHYRYDILSDTWATRAALSAPTFRAAAGAVGSNTIVLFGGGTNLDAYNTSHIYNIAADTWTPGPNMTTAHNLTGGTAVGNRLFVVGGWMGSGYTNVVETALVTILPCATPTITSTPTLTATATCVTVTTVGPWAPVATYTVEVRYNAVTTDGTYAYSIGGWMDHVGYSNHVQRYDPANNIWTSMANLPSGRASAGAAYAAVNNKIYLFGGTPNTRAVDIYDIATNSWTTGADMPGARYWHNVAYYGGNQKIYVIGGRDVSSIEQSQTWEYDPVANTWNTSRANIPVPMSNNATSIVGQYIYLMGGATYPGDTRHYRYDILSDTWAVRAAVPEPPAGRAAGAVGNSIIIFSAFQNTTQGKSYIYNTLTDSWTRGSNVNHRHIDGGGTAIGNLLIIVGGLNEYPAPGNVVETALVTIGGCGTPTITPTITPTPNSTATETPEVTPTNTAVPTETPTSTPIPTNTPTNTAMPTDTPTSTPIPTNTATPITCTTCSLDVTSVQIACNVDGTVHWTATVVNSAPCQAVGDYAAALAVTMPNGRTSIVQVQRGTMTFQPGTTLVQGDFCYQFAPNTRSVQAYFGLQTNSCSDFAPSNTISPCPVRPTCSLTFQDVPPEYKFYDEIMSLEALKVVSGYGDSTFRPEESMTRGEAVKTLVLAFDIPTGASSVAHFSDVPPNAPFFAYVEAAYKKGLVGGYKDGTFKPEQAITRGALVKIVVQAAGWELVKPQNPTFSDMTLDSPLYSYVETAVAHGLLDDVAVAGGSFQSDMAATRGESAAMIARAMSSSTSDLSESVKTLIRKLLEDQAKQ